MAKWIASIATMRPQNLALVQVSSANCYPLNGSENRHSPIVKTFETQQQSSISMSLNALSYKFLASSQKVSTLPLAQSTPLHACPMLVSRNVASSSRFFPKAPTIHHHQQPDFTSPTLSLNIPKSPPPNPPWRFQNRTEPSQAKKPRGAFEVND